MALAAGRRLGGVNPARAGMIPAPDWARLICDRKPRASGDDPGDAGGGGDLGA